MEQNASPTRDEIRDWFQKHRTACRCTGYKQIVDAVMEAADILRGEKAMTPLEQLYKDGDAIWGTRYPRPNAVYKATGTFDYGDDVALALPKETLYAVLVCPKTHHARVKSIDLAEAEKMSGVFKIVTVDDITANKGTNRIRGQVGSGSATTDGWDRRILVGEGDKIRQWGEAVAIVCADTETQARAAAEAVLVELEELPSLLSVDDALNAGDVRVYG